MPIISSARCQDVFQVQRWWLASHFVSFVATVKLSIPLFCLWDTLGNWDLVEHIAGHMASQDTKGVSVNVLVVIVAGLVAGLRQVERGPSADGVFPHLITKLSFPSAR